MEKIEKPLYPKLSSIYNKLLQLAIAIALIIVVLNLWLYSYNSETKVIRDNFNYVGQQFVNQTTASLAVVWQQDKKLIHQIVDKLAQQEGFSSIHVYDPTGQLIASNEGAISIRDLYGLTPSKINKSKEFVPFIGEVRGEKLFGYARVTLEKKYLSNTLDKSNADQYGILRLMIILSVGIGFLLTRGLNRFSRQGYRVAKLS